MYTRSCEKRNSKGVDCISLSVCLLSLPLSLLSLSLSGHHGEVTPPIMNVIVVVPDIMVVELDDDE
jgi:hypothetical protein